MRASWAYRVHMATHPPHQGRRCMCSSRSSTREHRQAQAAWRPASVSALFQHGSVSWLARAWPSHAVPADTCSNLSRLQAPSRMAFLYEIWCTDSSLRYLLPELCMQGTMQAQEGPAQLSRSGVIELTMLCCLQLFCAAAWLERRSSDGR